MGKERIELKKEEMIGMRRGRRGEYSIRYNIIIV
jgi:hypothetical protein